MNKILYTVILCMVSVLAMAQGKGGGPIVVDLWPEGAPNSNGLTGEEYVTPTGRVKNVTNPTLTIYPAQNGNGTTVIQCPGGGYVHLAIDHEGHDMAQWYNRQGITFVVLKYRMPNGNIEVALSDALQAIKMVREHHKEWNVDPKKVGISGCSAGGNLASMAATHYTSAEDRPDFQILFYPITTTDEQMMPEMFGKEPSQERIERFTNVKQVDPNSPPAFIMCSADDKRVPCSNSIDYFNALRNNGVEASLHIYPTGGHGWGFKDSFTYKKEWTSELERWLSEYQKRKTDARTDTQYKYLGERTYQKEDSLRIVEILNSAKTQATLGLHSEIIRVARSFLDIPYVGHTLEVNDEEKLVINLRELDCTTFVETVLALTKCIQAEKYGFDDYCYMLQKIRYGESDTVAYWNRNHYFFGWVAENEKEGLVRRITDTEYHTGRMEDKIDFMSTHVENYKMLNAHKEWVPRIVKMENMVTELHYPYIPKDKIDNSEALRNLIHDGDILGLTTNIKGLETQHLGFAVWKEDGLHLMNASLLHKKVVIEEKLLADYLKGQKRMTGVVVVSNVK